MGYRAPRHSQGSPVKKFEITREIGIDAAHRVPDHASKCFNLHGHRYTILATCRGPLIDSGEQTGMVVEFGFLKEEMMAVCDTPADHATILWEGDPMLEGLRPYLGKLVVLPVVPTAENLARYWFDLLAPRVVERSLGHAHLAYLTVWETPNCHARYPA